MTNRRIKKLIFTILTCCSLTATSLIVVYMFLISTTYVHLVIASLLYFLLVYLGFKAFPRKVPIYLSDKPIAAVQPQVKPAEEEFEVTREGNIDITDSDKRAFLKLIGATGLSLFLFSIFNKKGLGLFSKSLPGPGSSLSVTDGDKIDSLLRQPTDGYRIAEIDDNVITYYGFTNKDGAWFIMKEDTNTGSFRYSHGVTNFPGNWSNREDLEYDYFSNVF